MLISLPRRFLFLRNHAVDDAQHYDEDDEPCKQDQEDSGQVRFLFWRKESYGHVGKIPFFDIDIYVSREVFVACKDAARADRNCCDKECAKRVCMLRRAG